MTSGTAGQSLSIGLIPSTRSHVRGEARSRRHQARRLCSARPWLRRPAPWQAAEIHLLPPALQGAGEGLYPLPSAPDQRIATGAVNGNDGGACSRWSFAAVSAADGPTCTGRAPRQGGCKGEVSFFVDPKASIVAIRQGDKSILVPGKVAAISVVSGPDGHLVTPGLTIENETGGEVTGPAATAKAGHGRQISAETGKTHSPPDQEPFMRLLSALLAASFLLQPALAAAQPSPRRHRRRLRSTSPNSAASASISPPWIRASSRATISSCYVNGKWLKTAVIPPDRSQTGSLPGSADPQRDSACATIVDDSGEEALRPH